MGNVVPAMDPQVEELARDTRSVSFFEARLSSKMSLVAHGMDQNDFTHHVTRRRV